MTERVAVSRRGCGLAGLALPRAEHGHRQPRDHGPAAPHRPTDVDAPAWDEKLRADRLVIADKTAVLLDTDERHLDLPIGTGTKPANPEGHAVPLPDLVGGPRPDLCRRAPLDVDASIVLRNVRSSAEADFREWANQAAWSCSPKHEELTAAACCGLVRSALLNCGSVRLRSVGHPLPRAVSTRHRYGGKRLVICCHSQFPQWSFAMWVKHDRGTGMSWLTST